MTTVVFLLLVSAIVYRTLTPEARIRALRTVPRTLQRWKDYGRGELEPFRAALRARTPLALVTPALIAVNVVVFIRIWMGDGSASDPATLVGWGANFGPRTTGGEWWRLVTAMFVHSGLLPLVVNMAALAQAGFLLERLAGPYVFATAYAAAGLGAGVVSLSTMPLGVTAGASGAIFGVYGLLLVAAGAAWVRDAEVIVPLVALKRLAPIGLLLVLYTLADSTVTGSLVGIIAGVACGLIANRDIGVAAVAPRNAGLALAVALAIVVASALPLRGIADVGPEIQQLLALEQRTARVYEAALDRSRAAGMTPEALARLIDTAILPEFAAADARLAALTHVAPEDQERIAGARRYVQLRVESWRLRARTLRPAIARGPRALNAAAASDDQSRTRAEARYRSSTLARGKAEAAERAALEALDAISASRGAAALP